MVKGISIKYIQLLTSSLMYDFEYMFKSEPIRIWIDNAHSSKTKNLASKIIFPEKHK